MAFLGCPSLKKVIAEFATPRCDILSCFDETTLNTAILIVPVGSLKAYTEDEELGWNRFSLIKENKPKLPAPSQGVAKAN